MNYMIPISDLFDAWNFNRRHNRLSGHCGTRRHHWWGYAYAEELRKVDNGYEIKISLPGRDKNDVSVEIGDGTLSVNVAQEDSSDRLRDFCVPDTVDVNRIEANLSKGVLTILLPLKEEAQAKKIEVR